MRYNITALAAFMTSNLSSPAESVYTTGLPACSSTASTPCQCPDGTQYLEAVTVGVIGASAHDVGYLVNDFYNISWQLGSRPYKTKGSNNKVGSIRSVNYPLVPFGSTARTSKSHCKIIAYRKVVAEDVDERLVARQVSPDGSFTMSFEQVQPRIPYPDGTGVFAGWWGTITGMAATGDETILTWTNWACESRHIRNFAGFHEISFNNATAILTAQGKVRGTNVMPVSAQSFAT
ncbi:hypothetical protein GGS21DRAFT_494444 [Xylaria nigripes]|nr:hypothetical protein GGS21DRAFT_494444 [Xylaria nigripes]